MFKEEMYAFLMLFIFLILLYISEFKKPELTEEDYFNKFCTKYYDVSCDKIKIK